MKKLLLLCSLLVLRTGAFTACETVFQDDFSSGLSHWDQHWGSWSLSNGELIANYGISCGTPSCSQADLVLNDVTMPDNHWRASIDFIRHRDATHAHYYQAFGSFCMWQDANTRLTFGVGGGGWSDWGGVQDEVHWSVGCRNGGWQGIVSGTVPINWIPEIWHTATLEYLDGTYNLYFDGQYLGSYEDTYLYGEGTIGLHTYGTKRWDNFVLEECAEVAEASPVQEDFELLAPYPNPFNPSTHVSYTLDRSMDVRLSVHDLQGREVALLEDGLQSTGTHDYSFNATGLTSGVYFLRLQAEGMQQVHKLVLAR